MDDVEKIKRHALMLRDTNSRCVAEMEQLGTGVDFSIARMEMFMDFLVESGLITELQRWTEQERWERNMKAQIVPMLDKARAAVKPTRMRLN